MSKVQPDFKLRGKWVQRAWLADKYTWTVSGMLWNNIKERCKTNGTTQTRSPTYKGSTNKFDGFQQFAEWNREQIGYALGYQLDADILRKGNKIYSPDTCLLIPPSLNKFLQTSEGKRGDWPQGVELRETGDLRCRIGMFGGYYELGVFQIKDIDLAREAYKKAKDKAARIWCERLKTDYVVDPRVIDYMEKWEHICDWKPK